MSAFRDNKLIRIWGNSKYLTCRSYPLVSMPVICIAAVICLFFPIGMGYLRYLAEPELGIHARLLSALAAGCFGCVIPLFIMSLMVSGWLHTRRILHVSTGRIAIVQAGKPTRQGRWNDLIDANPIFAVLHFGAGNTLRISPWFQFTLGTTRVHAGRIDRHMEVLRLAGPESALAMRWREWVAETAMPWGFDGLRGGLLIAGLFSLMFIALFVDATLWPGKSPVLLGMAEAVFLVVTACLVLHKPLRFWRAFRAREAERRKAASATNSCK